MKTLLIILLAIVVSGCATNKQIEVYKGKAPYVEGTTTSDRLVNLPDLDNQPIITIAVYRFTDQTGQRKPKHKVFSIIYSGHTRCKYICNRRIEKSIRWRLVSSCRERRIR